jgi:hypothetical protein
MVFSLWLLVGGSGRLAWYLIGGFQSVYGCSLAHHVADAMIQVGDDRRDASHYDHGRHHHAARHAQPCHPQAHSQPRAFRTVSSSPSGLSCHLPGTIDATPRHTPARGQKPFEGTNSPDYGTSPASPTHRVPSPTCVWQCAPIAEQIHSNHTATTWQSHGNHIAIT